VTGGRFSEGAVRNTRNRKSKVRTLENRKSAAATSLTTDTVLLSNNIAKAGKKRRIFKSKAEIVRNGTDLLILSD
jgi:hypothetical protein